MIYFDTAYMVKCYVHEPGSQAVRELLTRNQTAACCSIGRVEFAAAIKRAIREGRLDPRVLDTVFSVLQHNELNGVWNWLPLRPFLIDVAMERIRYAPDGVFVRSADALHMTCARKTASGRFTQMTAT